LTSIAHTEEVSGSQAGTQHFVLKHVDTFMVSDALGDINGDNDGLFHNDTRVLSRFRLSIGDVPLVLLDGGVSQDNVLFTAHMTNEPLPPIGGQSTPEGIIHFKRTRLIWESRLYERLTIKNYSITQVCVPICWEFASDFQDMFEVRGLRRSASGKLRLPVITSETAILGYEGLDGIVRNTVLQFWPQPKRISSEIAEFEIALPADRKSDIYVEIGVEPGEQPCRTRFRSASARARRAMRSLHRTGATVRSSGHLFSEWLDKSRADLALLTTQLDTGPYPYAGIPWFSTAFGRDAIIASLQMLWLDPTLARGVLKYLSANQATELSPFHDAAPGKIMHETRKGEVTQLSELPFGKYYGGVDTTPLFVVLAGAYASRTADLEFIETLWPSLIAAMNWIEGDGDSNGDGFLDYARGRDTGLANQGWKDSQDSVFHADGSEAVGPIALVEVQGYVFAAYIAMADLSLRRGFPDESFRWREKAERLRVAVEDKFWIESLGNYALAVDGSGRPCCVRTSNTGHLLWSGLPTLDRAKSVITQLNSNSFYSGWGIRTLAREEVRYNPMSYHNGSVWPHDNALCTAGMSRYGNREIVSSIVRNSFETAVKFDMRLPELFCGFDRRAGEPPIAYPVACLPQAWASGSVFMLLQACLGINIDGWNERINVVRPKLPSGIDRIAIRNLAVGEVLINLIFQQVGDRIFAYSEGQEQSSIPIILYS